MALKKRAKETKKNTKEIVADAQKTECGVILPRPTDHIISTGSTLLDLAISCNRYQNGGIPGGILVEIFGPPGSGKTAILVEICASAQETHNSKVRFLDPEARLDKEYAEIYGMHLEKEDYHRPNTVTEMFSHINDWETTPDTLNVLAADSLAALSTDLELEKGDKMGMKRAKEFSTELRKLCRKIANQNRLIICSNQIRQGDYGDVTPGGKGIPYYASLRINIKPSSGSKIEKEKTVRGRKFKKVIGIDCECTIVKNSLDDPFRKAPVRIIFGIGIDDVGANLQWLKTSLGLSTYKAVDQDFKGLDPAINHIEKNNLETELRQEVIELYTEIENTFKTKRKKKIRFIV